LAFFCFVFLPFAKGALEARERGGFDLFLFCLLLVVVYYRVCFHLLLFDSAVLFTFL